MPEECFFCDKENMKKGTIINGENFFSWWDGNPVTKGHALVIPKKHMLSFFDLSDEELKELLDIMKKTKQIIDEKYNPDAYNIGVNDGEAAGRTVHHLHVHIIPRYKEDVKDPRGGVRHIIPGKGYY